MGRKGYAKDFIMGHLENEEAVLSNKHFLPLSELASIGGSRVYKVAKELIEDGTIYYAAGPSAHSRLRLRVYLSLNDIELPSQKLESGVLSIDTINIDGSVKPDSELDKLIEKTLVGSES